MARTKPVFAFGAAAALSLLMIACLTAPDLGPAFGIVAPTAVSIPVSTSSAVHYRVVGPRGDTLRGVAVVVKSADSTIASVVDDSTFKGVKVGTTTVSIMALDNSGVLLPGVEADIQIQVIADPVESVTMSLLADTLTVGDSVTLTATAVGSGGTTVTGHVFTWLTSNKAVAAVSSPTKGKVMAIAPGLAFVTATTDGGFSGTTSIIVKAKQ